MNRTRLVFSIVFCALIALCFWAAPGGAQPDTIRRIAPGVWFRQGDLETKGHCNNVVIEMQDYLIVVDANFPSGAELLLRDIRRLSGKPVKYVFDTHHHGDHAYGNPVWTRAGATTLAYAAVVEEMDRYEPERWRQAVERRLDVAKLKLETPERPQETFSESPYVLEDETRRVEFHHFGWAHTRGDAFVYLPEQKILCSGDAILNGPYNYTGDGNTRNWPNVISAVQQLDFETILPGHGTPAGPELAEGQKRFFTELWTAVESAIEAGKTRDEIVEVADKRGVKTSIELSDAVSKWVGENFPEQVRVTYEEITQGKPHGGILGGP